jgi:tRNA threonylcarbamoyladenosine biosynthesis protein TsaE
LPLTSLKTATHSPAATQKLGKLIGASAEAGDIILLSGPLGAGKTCMVQGIARGLGIKDDTPSPTFMLAREYRGRLRLFHIDLYRLDFQEISELGIDEYLYGQGVTVIELAEKDPELFGGEHLLIEIAYAGENARHINIKASGARYEKLLAALETSISAGDALVPSHRYLQR